MAFNLNALVEKTINKFKFRGVEPGTHGLPIIHNALSDAYEAGKEDAKETNRSGDNYYVRKSDVAHKLSQFKTKLDEKIDELTELYQEIDEYQDDLY